MKGDSTLHGSRQTGASVSAENAPRIFSRQAARFELLDSQSLRGMLYLLLLLLLLYSYNIRMCIDITLKCDSIKQARIILTKTNCSNFFKLLYISFLFDLFD